MVKTTLENGITVKVNTKLCLHNRLNYTYGAQQKSNCSRENPVVILILGSRSQKSWLDQESTTLSQNKYRRRRGVKLQDEIAVFHTVSDTTEAQRAAPATILSFHFIIKGCASKATESQHISCCGRQWIALFTYHQGKVLLLGVLVFLLTSTI